jgi:hypothetical protein
MSQPREAVRLPPHLIAGLEDMPRALESAIAQVPRARLSWRPADWGGSPGESFSAIEHACHVRDIERDGYHVRIRRLLEEDEPALVSIDGYALAAERRYADTPVAEALDGFREARRQTLAIVRDLDDARLDRSGTFAEYGRLTLRGLLHYLHSHDQQHLACVQWLLGRMASTGSGPQS